MNKILSFLVLSLLFSCTSIPGQEEIIPVENSVKESPLDQNDLDPDLLTKRNKACHCTFRTEVSPNLLGEEWDVTFRVVENGQTEIIVVDGDDVPMPPNPMTFSRHALTPLQIIPTSMRMLYGDPGEGLKEDGWIKVRISCQKAPSVNYTLNVPAYDLSGSVFTEKYTQLTASCGTVEVTKE